MEEILQLDRELFLELNSNFHRPWLDQFMMFVSATTAWIPLYMLLIYLLVRIYRRDSWLVFLTIALTILLADQITSSIMKPLFERLRPSHEPSLEGMVHIVDRYRGGRFGFASSHAANTFGIATLMWIFLRKYRPWIGALFLWAIGIGYSRVYLGVHYPGDILGGFVIGFIVAMLMHYLYRAAQEFLDRKRSLHPRGQ